STCKFLFLLSIAIVPFFSGCKEDDPKVTEIFIGGTDGGKPAYWKNDVVNYISDASQNYYVSSVIPNGSDIHATGYYTGSNGNSIAVYWKNGVMTQLADESKYTRAWGIALLNGDVYIVGTETDNGKGVAKYWKNGVANNLPDGTGASSIFIYENDIYIAGGNGLTAKYWKNGVGTNLSEGSAFGIFVSDNDVYVAGINNFSNGITDVVYWKNGVMTHLPAKIHTTPTGIYVSGSDVYVSGYCYPTPTSGNAMYWKNGVATDLPQRGQYAGASDIALSGNDVYISGYETSLANPNLLISTYWKNGELHILGPENGYSLANSIFISK
ncbi:MAG TPA: hypothetical protein VIT44_13335, partial [Cyclobacteriaceae bacterium]